jgi:hypothetical protein
MKWPALTLAILVPALGAERALAQSYCPNGQRPVPPAVAERMALPLCGFAAARPWTGNTCQPCDSRNMYPNPFAGDRRIRTRYYGSL